MGDVDPKTLKKTQDTLGKIIKKPPLSDKLLGKPPFRFLHDIVTSVIKTTGFMKGLYSEGEMNSENVKDKDSKLAFLQKLIDIVCLVVEKQLAVRTSKIVAGHEPDKTNELLQYLAEAINKKPSNDSYVKRVLKGEKFTGEKSSKTKSEKEAKDEKFPKDRGDDKSRDRREPSAKESRRGEAGDNKSHDKEEEKRRKDEDRGHDDEKHRDRSKEERNKEDRKHRRREEPENEESLNHENDLEADELQEGRPPRPKHRPRRQRLGDEHEGDDDPSRSVMQTVPNDNESGQPQDVPRGRSARPGSARPAPRIRKTEIVQEDAPVASAGNVPNIIRDQDKDSDSDDDMFITKDEDPMETAAQQYTSTTIVHQQDDDDDEEEGEHGGLVKKILENKKDLEGGSQNQQQMQQAKKVEIERSSQANDSQRRKDREVQQREVDKLRTAIQTVTRSVNPLDRSLNYVQEDLDAMQHEMTTWKKEHRENLLALQREESITTSSVEPLRAQLNEIDNQIRDQLDLIAAVKGRILANDNRLQKMLGGFSK